MSKMIFVNLPVADLKASMTFYEALAFLKKRFIHHDRCHRAV
ncbi:hypothetical protein [Stieleria neptunia]|nr:hypothetical protein [Stieleria neptunia]